MDDQVRMTMVRSIRRRTDSAKEATSPVRKSRRLPKLWLRLRHRPHSRFSSFPQRSSAAGALRAEAVRFSWPWSVTATSSSMRMPMPFQPSSIAGCPSGTGSRSLT